MTYCSPSSTSLCILSKCLNEHLLCSQTFLLRPPTHWIHSLVVNYQCTTKELNIDSDPSHIHLFHSAQGLGFRHARCYWQLCASPPSTEVAGVVSEYHFQCRSTIQNCSHFLTLQLMLIYSIQQDFKIKICLRKETRLDGNANTHTQSDSWLVDVTTGDDFLGLWSIKLISIW